MDSSEQVVEQLCREAIAAVIRRLSEAGIWPRPPRARVLRPGYDFYNYDLEDIPEVRDFLEHLASDESIQATYFRKPKEPNLYLLHGFWVQLLLRVLSETEDMSVRTPVFRKWYRRFVKELYSPTAIWRTIESVSGLDIDFSRLNLDGVTSLIACPAVFRSDRGRRLWGPHQYPLGSGWTPDGWGLTGMDKALLITTVSIPKASYADSARPYPHLTRHTERSLALRDTLRLVKRGVPRLNCFCEFQVSEFPLDDPMTVIHDHSFTGLYETRMNLNRGDMNHVRRLWQELMDTRYQESHTMDPLDIAFLGFSRSCEHGKSWIDTVLDLTIALESMFGPRRNDSGELRHRISLRAAWLLSRERDADSTHGKNRVYDCVRTMYDIRSRRVHGDTIDPKDTRKWLATLSGCEYDPHGEWQLIEAALESARGIVRSGLTSCMRLRHLQASGPCWPLPRNFDQSMLVSGQRRIWQRAAGVSSSPTMGEGQGHHAGQ